MEAIKPASLLALPREIQHSVFVQCNPIDLAALSASCRSLHQGVQGNVFLHKDAYLNHYDVPQADFFKSECDWVKTLQEAVYLEKIFQSTSREVKQASLPRTAPVILHLLRTAPIPSETTRHPLSHNISLLTAAFRQRENLNGLLCSSSLFRRGGGPDTKAADTPEARQLSAQLHVLYGVAVNPTSAPTHPNARSVVYDLRKYTDGSFWGPFFDDGSANVDWEKLEAVMVVLCYNLRQFANHPRSTFPQLWRTPFLGAYPRSYVSGEFEKPEVDQELSDLIERDPYGITGTWMRVVCFLDYSDLYTYNFADLLPSHIPRGELDTEEAIRLITMKLRVTDITEPGEGQGRALPVVHFIGTSRSMHSGFDPNANSQIRGTVSLTPAGEVRWTTYSVFHGEERWKSESIQVGGVRSARGVWGNWFDKDFDLEGPAGPTAFWKINDAVPPPPNARSAVPTDAIAHFLQFAQLANLPNPGFPTASGRNQLNSTPVVPIAGASLLNGAEPATVDDTPGSSGLYGRTSPFQALRRGPDLAQEDMQSDEDVGSAQPRGTLAIYNEEGETIGTLVAVDEDDEDEEDDENYVPQGTALEIPEEYEEDDDDDSDVPPPGGDDDVVIEEAYIEEEIVPYGRAGDMPDGEDLRSSQVLGPSDE